MPARYPLARLLTLDFGRDVVLLRALAPPFRATTTAAISSQGRGLGAGEAAGARPRRPTAPGPLRDRRLVADGQDCGGSPVARRQRPAGDEGAGPFWGTGESRIAKRRGRFRRGPFREIGERDSGHHYSGYADYAKIRANAVASISPNLSNMGGTLRLTAFAPRRPVLFRIPSVLASRDHRALVRSVDRAGDRRVRG